MTEGEINRYRIALPMLDIVTIGAGGGSIGWIDEGGLLRMGPDSAGADPGPACYGRGGTLPTCTDADLVLGYLDAEFFAGGRIKLDRAAAVNAIEEHVARPLGMSVDEAAAGMYEVINTNMARGVREVSIKRGFDPREFPVVAAGGAGPLHAAMICRELEIPMFIVPRESSIFCAAGMLLSDLQHDLVSSFVCTLDEADWPGLDALISRMIDDAKELLDAERIPPQKRRFLLKLDCRYVKQYHEVSFPVDFEVVRAGDMNRIASAFHAAHLQLYGYALEDEEAQIELINVRVRAIGVTDKFESAAEPLADSDSSAALKGERVIYVPQERISRTAPVYDGHRTRHGNRIIGPAVIEQVNTTLLLTASNDCFCDKYGSFIVYQKGRAECIAHVLEETTV
jgi:N-methylhydantoinase A